MFLLLKWVDDLPICLHIHHNPPMLGGFVKRLVQSADRRPSVICPFSVRIGVTDEHPKAGPRSRCRPLEHLQVAV
jgi:hypothetical protein